jgi:hypothetical protein
MARRTTAKKSEEQLPSKPYLLSLSVADHTYKGEGDTILEALEQIKPTVIKGKAVFNLTFGDLSSELVMYPLVLKRLFVNKISREIFQKRMGAALK